MKIKYFLLAAICFYAFYSAAQNVGIGTTNPLYKLHIANAANGLRIEGPATGGIGNTSLSIGGYGDVAIDKPGIIGGRLTIKENGNVGIGIGDPGFPLTFHNSTGDKISLFGNSGAHYGFGVQPFLLQIHSGANSDDIAFGYGNSTSFTESMRIKGNGNVGIGTSIPNAPLQFNNNSANRKLVLYDVNNDDNQFFGFGINGGILRYQVNSTLSDHVFYAGISAAASNELMRIKGNGALQINGSTGQAGQILSSKGPNTAAAWVNPGTIIKTGASGVTGPVQLPPTAEVVLSGSQYTITLERTARVILQYKIQTSKPCAIGSCNTKCRLAVLLNNNYVTDYKVDGTSYNSSFSAISSATLGPDYFDLGPGTYTFTIVAANAFNQPTIENFQILSTIIEQ
jgi:hypothetical protein